MKRKEGPVGFRLARRLVPAPPPTTHDCLGHPLDLPCQLWQGTLIRGGYGLISYGGGRGNKLVHRVAYALANGLDVDEFPELDHRCRVRHCAEPSHLEPVTRAENIRRGVYPPPKTHCPQNHPYDEANTYVHPDGRRTCRICTREAGRHYDAQHPHRSRDLRRAKRQESQT